MKRRVQGEVALVRAQDRDEVLLHGHSVQPRVVVAVPSTVVEVEGRVPS